MTTRQVKRRYKPTPVFQASALLRDLTGRQLPGAAWKVLFLRAIDLAERGCRARDLPSAMAKAVDIAEDLWRRSLRTSYTGARLRSPATRQGELESFELELGRLLEDEVRLGRGQRKPRLTEVPLSTNDLVMIHQSISDALTRLAEFEAAGDDSGAADFLAERTRDDGSIHHPQDLKRHRASVKRRLRRGADPWEVLLRSFVIDVRALNPRASVASDYFQSSPKLVGACSALSPSDDSRGMAAWVLGQMFGGMTKKGIQNRISEWRGRRSIREDKMSSQHRAGLSHAPTACSLCRETAPPVP